jgi:hypothetical protein
VIGDGYPAIPRLAAGIHRPTWSVMIPACDRTTYLRQTIDSVLGAGLPAEDMQICLVDNSKSGIDWSQVLSATEARRIEVHRQPTQVAIDVNWTTCILQARGSLVHILHDDDWVLPGFYSHLARLADDNPDIALFAVRCFLVDPEAIIEAVAPRMPVLEKGTRDPAELFTRNNLYCPGIVVRRQAYEECGGFSCSNGSVLDWEMWCRIIGHAGGRVSPAVLACYRTQHASYYSNAARTARNLRDFEALYRLQRARFPHFPAQAADRHLLGLARYQADSFRRLNDPEAAAASAAFWSERAPIVARLRRAVGDALRILRLRS